MANLFTPPEWGVEIVEKVMERSGIMKQHFMIWTQNVTECVNSLLRRFGWQYSSDSQYTDLSRRQLNVGTHQVTIDGLKDNFTDNLPPSAQPFWDIGNNLFVPDSQNSSYSIRLRFNQAIQGSEALIIVKVVTDITDNILDSDPTIIVPILQNQQLTYDFQVFSGGVFDEENARIEIEIASITGGSVIDFWDFDIYINKVG